MEDSRKVVVFESGDEEYGISIEAILSIEKDEKVTPIPHLPSYMLGMINVRGELVPILDFEQILYHRSSEGFEQAKIIVLKTDDLSFAIRVKEAKEIVDIPGDRLKQMGLVAYGKTTYFTAIAQLDDRLITIIDPTILAQSLDGMKQIQSYMKEFKAKQMT
ncbi:chemotaxis protein CheW [Jeotgalibacillus marinus]|uniref:Chemotaxis protein CheW n=1 Tax=Jeotgalibacillus marinus TaxID=86667 RepID=A0ABV3Q0K2_9BACL